MRILLSALALAVTALPVQARISLDEIEAHLNAYPTYEAKFEQYNADGTVSTGALTMKRPGRARFAYDAPSNALVIAGGGQIAIFDPVSNTAPEQYPLSQTPLSLILAEQVEFGRSAMVVGHVGDAKSTSVTLMDREEPDRGSIKLVFMGDPVRLSHWVIEDGSGTKTTVVLDEILRGQPVRAGDFSIPHELRRRGLED